MFSFPVQQSGLKGMYTYAGKRTQLLFAEPPRNAPSCVIGARARITHLWREAIAYGGVDGVAVSSGGYEAVRVTREAMASGRQAVRRASILGARRGAESALVHRRWRERLRSVNRAGLL